MNGVVSVCNRDSLELLGQVRSEAMVAMGEDQSSGMGGDSPRQGG